MRRLVDFWYRRISRRATVPGLYLCGRLSVGHRLGDRSQDHLRCGASGATTSSLTLGLVDGLGFHASHSGLVGESGEREWGLGSSCEVGVVREPRKSCHRRLARAGAGEEKPCGVSQVLSCVEN